MMLGIIAAIGIQARSKSIAGYECTEKWYTWSRLEGFPHGSAEMCDYSLQHVKSRPAKVGDKLTTRDFGTGTRGFAASENAGVAVCVLPGTELFLCWRSCVQADRSIGLA